MLDAKYPEGVAVVTGAAAGMGAASARLLNEAGWSLLLCDLNADKLEQMAGTLRRGGDVKTLAGDIAAAAFPKQLATALDGTPVGALIHCAGLSPSMADPGRIMQVNLGASISLLDTVRPRMTGGAAAVLLASVAGHMLGTALDEVIERVMAREDVVSLMPYAPTAQAAYAVSKRGVQLLVRRQALAFGRQGARIVSISPGIIDTPMSRAELAAEPVMKDMIASAPLPRMGRAEEVASVAVFFCSSAAGFVTGVDLPVDGGALAVLPTGGAAS